MYDYNYYQLEANFNSELQCSVESLSSFRASSFELALEVIIKGEDFAFFPIESLSLNLKKIYDLNIYTREEFLFNKEDDPNSSKQTLKKHYNDSISSLINNALYESLNKAENEFCKYGIDKGVLGRWVSRPSTVEFWHADVLFPQAQHRIIIPLTAPGTFFCNVTIEEKAPFLKAFSDNNPARKPIWEKCNEQELDYQLAAHEGAIYKTSSIHKGPKAINRTFIMFYVYD